MNKHKTETGRGNCRSKSQRSKVWKTAQTSSGKLSSNIPKMEKQKDYWNGRGRGLRNANVNFSVSGGDLRKRQIVISGLFSEMCTFL